MTIDKVDKNFVVSAEIRQEKIKVYDACEQPFEVYGLIKPQGTGDCFRRMPEDIAKSVSDSVHYLSTDTAGGRVRFRTNSSYIAIQAEMPDNRIGRMPHFAFTGSAGFDVYAEKDGKQVYVKTFVPPYEMKNGYASGFDTQCSEMREYTINFPLYSEVSKLYIILDENAQVEKCRPYKTEKPVVYYGSSITQGGCASRPGNSYQSIISRALDCNFINLGFSGSAKAEHEIAEYIAGLDMSVFVYDYDHNAPTVEYLRNTHKTMFDTVRKSHPDLPIICVSRPVKMDASGDERRQIIMNTVETAKSHGDKNVYFVDGMDFAKCFDAGDSISVDGCHPNDLGFWCMATVIGEAVGKVLKRD